MLQNKAADVIVASNVMKFIPNSLQIARLFRNCKLRPF